MKRTLRVFNLLGFLLVITVNFLANYLPIGGKTTGEVSRSINTLFTPAGYTFMIWGLIYLLLLGFTIYQLLPSQKYSIPVHKIGVYFFLTSLMNALWLFAWQNEKIWLSLIIMVLLLIFLIEIYNRLDIGNCDVSCKDRLWIHVPFSIYLAWISVATIANTAAALKYYGFNGFGLSETVWTVIAIILAVVLTFAVVCKNNDLVYVLTIVWALTGILVRHCGDNTAITVTVIGGIALLVLLAFNKFKKYFCLE